MSPDHPELPYQAGLADGIARLYRDVLARPPKPRGRAKCARPKTATPAKPHTRAASRRNRNHL